MKPFIVQIFYLLLLNNVFGQSQSPNLLINGTEVFVKTIGKGSPIIVIHGGPGLNHTYLLPHLSSLAQKHQLIFYDQRACGQTSGDVDSTQMSLDLFVKDIDEIRKQLNLEKVTILAHSWGGLLGMRYASEYPQYIESLILVNTVSPLVKEYEEETNRIINKRYTKKDSTLRANILRSPEFKSGNLNAYSQIFRLSFKQSFYDTAYVNKMNLILSDDFVEKRKKIFLLAKDLNSYNFYPSLKSIKCPTLIIYGAYDAVPLALSQKIQKNIKGSKLVTIEKAGHFPFIEQQPEFTKIVNNFLR